MDVVDVSLENLAEAPAAVRGCVFWELDQDQPPVDAAFLKEEWFSSTLLEWGGCGKLLTDGSVVGFAEFGPPSLFPRLTRFRCGNVSPDAVYLSYCYVVPERRGQNGGTKLIESVAGDLFGRGFRALEAIAGRECEGEWVLPMAFLETCGFAVIRDDSRFPLMRLELTPGREPAVEAEAVALPEV
jgi:GNAT superfamily N-acetyltransferase